MDTKKTITRTLYGQPITAEMTVLGTGTHVLLYGGELSHIGAISVVSPEGELSTTIFPGHKEGLLSERWAKELCALHHLPVVVTAGIHYDHATRDQIMEIVALTDEMLAELLDN